MNRNVVTTFSVLLAAAAGAWVALGCGGWQQEEIRRITSPDSAVDLVVVRGSAGATTSLRTEAYLVPVGEEVPDGRHRAAFCADHVTDLDFEWRRSKLVDISYRYARIRCFRNWVLLLGVRRGERYVVDLNLEHTGEGSSLHPRDRGG